MTSSFKAREMRRFFDEKCRRQIAQKQMPTAGHCVHLLVPFICFSVQEEKNEGTRGGRSGRFSVCEQNTNLSPSQAAYKMRKE